MAVCNSQRARIVSQSSRKGTHPVMAVLLLIGITVAASIIFYSFTVGFMGKIRPPDSGLTGGMLVIDSVNVANGSIVVHVKNLDDVAVKISKIYIESFDGSLKLALTVKGAPVTVAAESFGTVRATLTESLDPGSYLIKVSGINAMVSYAVKLSSKVNGWLEGWKYRRIITITEQSGTTLTNYQVKITLTPANFDYGKAQSDGSDLRFTSEDGVTLLPYWIESWNYGGTSTIWVKVSEIPASSKAHIYMYYGNSTASSQSNPHQVFLFYDDFDDRDISDWSSIDATISAVVFDSKKCLKLEAPSTGSNFKHLAIPSATFSADRYIAEAYLYDDNPAGSLCVHYKDSDNWWGVELYNGMHIFRPYIGGADQGWVYQTAGTTPTDQWYHLRVNVLPDHVNTYIDGTQVASWDIDAAYQFTGYNKMGLVEHKGYGPLYCDYLFVRKYASPEPTVSIGGEQTT
ncbi:MAG: DUF2341 domain-containing protein [Candidatus Verstraetearchaeota archaeon]|nr:DUF2341 domain-containing protein [Candidatus Verstraetearchaeota archaeon]